MADAYDEAVTPMMTPYAEEALRRTALAPGDRALDVAAGPGALAIPAARRGARVLATDFAPGMVERLRRRAKEEALENLQAVVMDAQALTVDDGAMDAAYCVFGAMFFTDRAKGFREMRRVLRPEGRAAVVTWGPPEKSDIFSAFFSAVADVAPDLPEPTEPPTPVLLADPAGLERELREVGFRDVDVQPVMREVTMGTPEETWTDIAESNPVMPLVVEKVGDAREPALREAVIANLRPRAGPDGRVRARAEANVALARRP